MIPMLRVVASLRDLRSVCFAVVTLRRVYPVAEGLRRLTGLTALDLCDTGISSHAVEELSSALTELRRLLMLDVSDNRLRLLRLRGLVRGIACCTTLQVLRMLRTVSDGRPAFGGAAVLARYIPSLLRLTELRIGNCNRVHSTADAQGFGNEYLCMLQAVKAAYGLRCFELRYPEVQVQANHSAGGCCVWIDSARGKHGQ